MFSTVTGISLLVFTVAQSHSKEFAAKNGGDAQDSLDKLADVLTDKLANRFFDTPFGGKAELDSTTLAKPGQGTLPQHTSLVRATPPSQPLSTSGGLLSRVGMPASSSVRSNAASGSSGSASGSVTDVGRRALMVGMSSVAGSLTTGGAKAFQGYTAGRIPGIRESDKDGFNVYTRPEGKQGGHGIGWSEIPPYSFLVPESWNEIPVSIADLGGTEVDLRFKDPKEGDLAVVVAPVMRFANIGFNANVKIDELGSPQKMIEGFGPEILGQNVDEILESTSTRKVDGVTYYDYEMAGHILITMTAAKNRVYIMTVKPRSFAWRKMEDDFRAIADSFRVMDDRAA